ncbi:MAG: hypothetical protein ACJASL_002301 [Paraglaciecola sp.]|jgi:hypothetical protein
MKYQQFKMSNTDTDITNKDVANFTLVNLR